MSVPPESTTPPAPLCPGDVYRHIDMPCITSATDPCSLAGDTTLYYVLPCTATTPTMQAFCTNDPSHPVCVGVPTTAPPGTVDLPATGGPLTILAVAAAVTVAGLIARRSSRSAA